MRTAVHQLEDGWRRENAFFRAFSPTSEFQFVASHVRPELEVVYRTPAGAGPESLVAVRVNGEVCGRLPSSPSWRRAWMSIDRALLREPFNVLTVEWPMEYDESEDGPSGLAQRLDLARWGGPDATPNLFPGWGDIQQFTVRA